MEGRETIQEIFLKIHERERILLLLPAGFHYAVTEAMGATGAIALPLDMALNDTAFNRLTATRGLRELAELRAALTRYAVDVRVRTPPPHILFVPAKKPAFSAMHRSSHPSAAVAR